MEHWARHVWPIQNLWRPWLPPKYFLTKLTAVEGYKETGNCCLRDLLFEFFKDIAYDGFFLRGRNVMGIDSFDVRSDQDETVLLNDGGRQNGRSYNNFFFFPSGRAGGDILARK